MKLRRLVSIVFALPVAVTSAVLFGISAAQADSGNAKPSIEGSGTYGSIVNCELSFHVKASVDGNGVAHGFQDVTAPQDNCGVGPGGGHLRATVTCVSVAGNVGEMRGIVTESTGPLFSQYLNIQPGDVLFSQAQENSQPVPDQIFQDKGLPGSENACVAGIDPLKFPLDSGNVKVRQ